MANCCDPSGYRGVFNEKEAKRVARSFRRKGLDSTAGPMVEALAAEGIEGTSLLEIGAGSGTAQVALLGRGVERSVAYDISPAYEPVAAALFDEYAVADRVEWRTGDFLANGAPDADIVLLNRVVCCYPDMAAMVDTAADRSRRLLALSYPRDRLVVRIGQRLVNAFLRLRKNSFRVFVHTPEEIERRVSAAGLEEVAAGRTQLWHWKVWRRSDRSDPPATP